LPTVIICEPKRIKWQFKSAAKPGLAGYNITLADQYFIRAGLTTGIKRKNRPYHCGEGIPAYDALGGQVAYHRRLCNGDRTRCYLPKG
jgi:hypothetical protein